MGLHENQLYLIKHMVKFNVLDYSSCLKMLATPELTDPIALSYAFRPLTKNGYLSKRKDGSVSITAKGRALFPDITPVISTGGGANETRRVIEVSRTAALMEYNSIPTSTQIPQSDEPCFIPSACWRNIAPGILSTTRFVGMLIGYGLRLAVYSIGDGHMEWQVRAEGSLFYTKYGNYETRATGMLLICQEDKRIEVAQNIIRQTMWNRRQLLKAHCVERNRPTRWSRSPIKLRTQYEHVYLTTPELLLESLQTIWAEAEYVDALCDGGTKINEPQLGDIEIWPRRLFVNPATDLLKYVYFFSEVKRYLSLTGDNCVYTEPIDYEIYIQPMDRDILRMYPDVIEAKEVSVYVYQSETDAEGD